MTASDEKYYKSLVHEFLKLPKETEWLEFKLNNAKPDLVGEYISALANEAVLADRQTAYLIWGIDDDTHEIVGTSFNPSTKKVGNEDLESWVLHLLNPRINFSFHALSIDDNSVVLLEINRPLNKPVAFKGTEYCRIGTTKKPLKGYPERERELWRKFDKTLFEDLTALENIAVEKILELIDYPTYFDLLDLPLPPSRDLILESMIAEDMIKKEDNGRFSITNLGAILFAKKLTDFPKLSRKAVRVIIYKGNNKFETVREQEGTKGYASGFEGLIEFINNLLPSNEEIGAAFRKKVPVYPELAIRELAANALIHQDFSVSGSGPTIEIFENRMEITNPGDPLVKTERFLDSPPRSRNEKLAAFMRRIGICEERGSGIDKVVFQTEFYQLPAPSFEVVEYNTISILFKSLPLKDMDKEARIRACYLHACLKHVSREQMNNASVRKRFGIEEQNKAIASRYIKEAVDSNLIKLADPSAASRLRRYIPFWA